MMKHEKYCVTVYQAFLNEWQNRKRMVKARSKADSYVCRCDEIELLLCVTLEGLKLSEYNIYTTIAIWKCWGDDISISLNLCLSCPDQNRQIRVFIKSPSWNVLSKTSIFGGLKLCLCVDGRPTLFSKTYPHTWGGGLSLKALFAQTDV